jgi:hypothetical protein
MIKAFIRTGGDSRGFEKKVDLIKSHVSKGTDRQPFSTPKTFRDRLSVYKTYNWI